MSEAGPRACQPPPTHTPSHCLVGFLPLSFWFLLFSFCLCLCLSLFFSLALYSSLCLTFPPSLCLSLSKCMSTYIESESPNFGFKLILQLLFFFNAFPQCCVLCHCGRVRSSVNRRMHTLHICGNGAGGAPRQAQVLLAGRGAPAGKNSCLQECIPVHTHALEGI